MNEHGDSSTSAAPPIFAKRKGPSKRRVRNTAASTPVATLEEKPESNPAAQSATNAAPNVLPSHNHLTPMRVVKRPRSTRRRIRAQGDVPGYSGPFSKAYDESDERQAQQQVATDYSAEGLRKLRLQSVSNAPKTSSGQNDLNDTPMRTTSPPLHSTAAIPVPDLPPPPAPPKSPEGNPVENVRAVPVSGSLPDPFSSEWRGEQHDARFDTAFVSDMMDTEETSFIPLSAHDGQKAVFAPTEEDDLAWETRQLRRAGHEARHETPDDAVEKLRWAREIVREEEERIVSNGKMKAMKRCGEFLAEANLDLQAKLELAQGRFLKAEEAEGKAILKAAAIDTEIEEVDSRLQFYGEVVNAVRKISDELRVGWAAALIRRKELMGRLEERAVRVAEEMKSCVDEFGRFRPRGVRRSDTPSPPASPRMDGWMERADEIIQVFSVWKKRYGGEYAASEGDREIGRVLGVMQFVHESGNGTELKWLSRVPEASRGYAVLASRACEVFAAEIAVRWDPCSESCCKRFGRDAKLFWDSMRVAENDVKGEMDGICNAFEKRLLLEARCVLDRDGEGVMDSLQGCIKGGKEISKQVERDIGVDRIVLMAARWEEKHGAVSLPAVTTLVG